MNNPRIKIILETEAWLMNEQLPFKLNQESSLNFQSKAYKNICVIKQSSTVVAAKRARTKQIINIHVIYDRITLTGKLQPD